MDVAEVQMLVAEVLPLGLAFRYTKWYDGCVVKRRLGRPPLAPDTGLYAFRLSASVMAQVDRYADRRGITRSAALRELLGKALQGRRSHR